MIRDLVELLDRRWKLLDDETGFDFARNCFPFLEELRRDSRTSALLADLRRDEQKSFRARAQADDDARASLMEILDLLERSAPGSFAAPPEDQDEPNLSLPALRRLLTKRTVDLDDEGWHAGNNSGSESQLETVIATLEEASHNAKREDLKEHIDGVRRALEYAERTRRMFVRTSAAAALARIERALGDLHPSASKQGWQAETARLLRIQDGGLHESGTRCSERAYG